MTDEQNVPPSSDPEGKSGIGPGYVSGVILKDTSGNLYFVPDRALSTFHVVSATGKAAVQAEFDKIHSGHESAPALEAFHVRLLGTHFGPAEICR